MRRTTLVIAPTIVSVTPANTRRDYGPLEAVLDGYGALISARRDEMPAVLDGIERVVRETDLTPWLPLLIDGGWRPHLIGCVVLLLDDEGKYDRQWLWDAIDHGSWALPQLVATAYLADDRFLARARERLGGASAQLLVSFLGLDVPELTAEIRGRADIEEVIARDARDHSDQIVRNWMTAMRGWFEQRGRVLRPRV